MTSRQSIRQSASRRPRWDLTLLVCLMVVSATLLILALASIIPEVRADNVAYRQQLCGNASQIRGSVDLVGDVEPDVDTRDEPQLRDSAARYRQHTG
jgi:hypothetical protein